MEYLKKLKIEYVETDIKNPVRGQVEKPEDVYVLFKDMEKSDKEKVVAVYLNARMVINTFEVLSIGGTQISLLSPKEVFKGALLTNSVYFILLHNHPSGNPEPSARDRRMIKKIQMQSHIMDIEMVDFIIVGQRCFWSWKAQDYLTA